MGKNITVIPAGRIRDDKAKTAAKSKLKVAAYCRVSTDSDEQATSYEAQVTHYTNFIQSNPEWQFAGVFADDGISGTGTKKREGFNRMISECMNGSIDMVITKSISRFARNTVDCLKYIRLLKGKNIPVFFEKENINTMDARGEVLITIMASLAQQESESLSKNVKLGLQFRYQNGEVQVNHNRFLGYTKDESGHLIIDPEQAEIVKRIFYEYLQGKSLQQIGDGLMADGILTAAGKKIWRGETIRKILKNEKYMGDALLQKTYTIDCLTKKRVKNTGIVPQYYVSDDHEAIIPKELFEQVQDEMLRRANIHAGKNKRIYSSKYALSSLVRCGKCGDIYRRIVWNNHGKKSVRWRCVTRVQHGPDVCDAPNIPETELQEAVRTAVNQTIRTRNETMKVLRQNIESVIFDGNLEEINRRLTALQEELLRLANERKSYSAVAAEIDTLREQREKCMKESAAAQGIKQRIECVRDFLKSHSEELEEYDENLTRLLIESITVYEDRLIVEFKSGTQVEIKRK